MRAKCKRRLVLTKAFSSLKGVTGARNPATPLPQVSSVQSFSRVWLFMTPWTAARQASLSITNSRSLLKLEPIQLVKPSHHLILCAPLLLLPSVFPRIRVFSNDSVLRIRWPKYWSFSFSISPSNEYSGPRGQLGLFLWPPSTSRNQSERQSLTAEPSAPHLSPDTGQKQATQGGDLWRGDCAPSWAEMLQTRPEPREPEEPGERRRGKRSLSTLLATWESEASGAYWIPWRPWGIHGRPSRQRLPRRDSYLPTEGGGEREGRGCVRTGSSRLSGMCGRACWGPEVCMPLTLHQRNPPRTHLPHRSAHCGNEGSQDPWEMTAVRASSGKQRENPK